MRILLALAATLISSSAFAHTGHGDTSGIMHGFMHPIAGLDHVLAMIAVGVLAVIAGGRAIYVLPLSFMAAMVAGGVIGMFGLELPLVETGIGASIVVIAGLAALGYALPVWVYGLIVAFFGMFHGFAHGAEMPVDASGSAFAAGFVAATALLHITGIAAATAFGARSHTATRIGSGIVALTGAAVLSGAL